MSRARSTRMRRAPDRRWWWAALGLALAAGHGAQADERVEARRYFQAGMADIAAGQYDKGVEQLLKAYEILPHPVVLYNVGRAWVDAGEYEKALPYLERYVASDPPDKAQAQQLLTFAREQLRTAARSPTPPAADAQASPAPAPVAVTSTEPAPEGPQPEAAPGAEAPPTTSPAVAPPEAAELAALTEDVQRLAERLAQLSARAAEAAAAPRQPAPAPLTPAPTPAAAPSGTTPPPVAAPEASAPPVAAPQPTSAPGADPYGQVVVTSSRYQQSPLDAPNALTVLTREDIRQSGARTLPDLLRRVPGIDVMALTPGDYNLGIRGFNSTLANKVLVLVDGRTVYLDFIGSTLWPFLSVSLSDIERIEVVRGPGAALYGANAFSGVINIITRTPGDPSDRSELTARGGAPDWVDGAIHATGRGQGTAWRVSAGFEQTERWSVEIDPSRPDYQIAAPDPEHATNLTRLDMRVDQRLGEDASLSLSGGLTNGQAEFTAIGAVRDFLVSGQTWYTRADLALPEGFSLRAFWNHADVYAGPWAVPTGGPDLGSQAVSNVLDTELGLYREFHAGVDQRLNAGLGYRHKSIDWERYLAQNSPASERHYSFFVQDEARLTRSLTLLGSLRVDRHPLISNPDTLQEGENLLDRFPTSPRAAVIYRLTPESSLRATAGTAFRQPTFLESYNQLQVPTSNDAVTVLSDENRLLNPERIFSAEVGYLSQPDASMYEWEAAAYFNRVQDVISLGDAPANLPPIYNPETGSYEAAVTSQVNNPDVFTAAGAELGVKLYPRDGLDLYANYAYEYILREAPCTNDEGVALATAPEGCASADSETGTERVLSTSPSKFNVGVQYRDPSGMELSTDASLVQRQVWTLLGLAADGSRTRTEYEIPTYVNLTARLGYHTQDERLEFAVEGSNLLALVRTTSVPAQAATADEPGSYGIPQYTHREYPLGQAVPWGISGSVTYRF